MDIMEFVVKAHITRGENPIPYGYIIWQGLLIIDPDSKYEFKWDDIAAFLSANVDMWLEILPSSQNNHKGIP